MSPTPTYQEQPKSSGLLTALVAGAIIALAFLGYALAWFFTAMGECLAERSNGDHSSATGPNAAEQGNDKGWQSNAPTNVPLMPTRRQ